MEIRITGQPKEIADLVSSVSDKKDKNVIDKIISGINQVIGDVPTGQGVRVTASEREPVAPPPAK